MSTAPLFISILTPHPVKSSFCAGIQFSRDPIRWFSDQKKYEKIEGCEQYSSFLIAVNRERTKLFPVIREWKYSHDSLITDLFLKIHEHGL